MEAMALLQLLFLLVPGISLPSVGQSKLPYRTPQFMVNLFNCVSHNRPLDCYGVNANSVVSSIGYYQNDRTAAANESRIRFNASAVASAVTQRNDTLLSAEIRLYRMALSQSERDHLDACGCSSTKIQLYATTSLEAATGIIISSVPIRSYETGKEQWVCFGNLTSIYEALARDDQLKNLTITLVVRSPCGLRQLGFTDVDGHDPLLVAYFASSSGGLGIISGAVLSSVYNQSAVRIGVRRRASSPCGLVSYQVDLEALGLTNYYPATYDGNLCIGQCTVPTGSFDPLYTTEHAMFQYFLSTNNPGLVASPCCVPQSYGLQSFLVYGTSAVTLRTLSRAIATSCQCA